MTHVPHDLHAEFPGDAALLHKLKTGDPHFARLAEEYHELNRTIHRGETDIEPMGDAHLEQLKKMRLSLLDRISAIITEAKAGAV